MMNEAQIPVPPIPKTQTHNLVTVVLRKLDVTSSYVGDVSLGAKDLKKLILVVFNVSLH